MDNDTGPKQTCRCSVQIHRSHRYRIPGKRPRADRTRAYFLGKARTVPKELKHRGSPNLIRLLASVELHSLSVAILLASREFDAHAISRQPTRRARASASKQECDTARRCHVFEAILASPG